LDQDQGRGLTALGFAFGELLLKSTKSNQKCLLLVGLLLRRSTFTPGLLRGPAAIRHPWRGAALAASLRLGPLRKPCVQPAPKSRLAVTGPFVYEDQRRITADQRQSQGRSKASRLKPVPLTARAVFSGTGFSREAFASAFCYCCVDHSHAPRGHAPRDARRHSGTPSPTPQRAHHSSDRSHALRGNAGPDASRPSEEMDSGPGK
jgi:hypothetical protein